MRAGLWIALAALAAFAAPQDVRAQDSGRAAFDAFRDVCVAGNGDADYAVGKLRAQGWVAAPDEIVKAMQQQVGPGAAVLLNFDIETMETKTPTAMGLTLALVGVAPPEAFGGMSMTGPFCAIAPLESDAGAIRRSFDAYYAFQPYDTGEGAMWIYTLERGVIVPADTAAALSDEEGPALLRSAPHFVSGIQQEDEMTILLFMRLVP